MRWRDIFRPRNILAFTASLAFIIAGLLSGAVSPFSELMTTGISNDPGFNDFERLLPPLQDEACIRFTADQFRGSQPPLSNADDIHLSASAMSPKAVIDAIDARGGNFDFSPKAVKELLENGVSESVLHAMQLELVRSYCQPK